MAANEYTVPDVHFIKPTRQGSIRWRVESGYTAASFDPRDQREIARAANEIGYPVDDFIDLVRAELDRPTAPPGQEPPKPVKIRLRAKEQPAAEAQIIESVDPAGAFLEALGADVKGLDDPVLQWDSRDDAVRLDIDRRGEAKLKEYEAADLFPATLPRPLAWWRSSTGNLAVLFVAVEVEMGEGRVERFSARALAGAWYLLGPLGRIASWSVEAKKDTRHPAGVGKGGRCGRVHYLEPSASMVVPGGRKAAASLENIEDWKAANGYNAAERQPHDLCPFDPCPSSRDPVVVNEDGIRCHRCERSATWDQLVGETLEDAVNLYQSARAWVHLPHIRHVLGTLRDNIPTDGRRDLIGPAWRLMLYSANEARLAAFQPDGSPVNDWAWKAYTAAYCELKAPRIARSATGGWLNSKNLEPRSKVTTKTTQQLPWSMGDGARAEEAADNGHLEGFTPLYAVPTEAVIAPYEAPPYGAVLVRCPHRGGPSPVDYRDEPDHADVERAWTRLFEILPGLNRGYLSTLLLSAMVARRGDGLPPIISVTGPTGSGKTSTMLLAGAMLGRQAGQVQLGDAEDAHRQMGLSLEVGASLIYVDEIGRARNVRQYLQSVLDLSGVLTYRPKYSNERKAAFRASIVLLGSTLPEALTLSPELGRRAVGFYLPDKCDWNIGEMRKVREDEQLRPILDTITADIWHRVHRAGRSIDWRQLARKEYGAVSLADLELDADEAAGRDATIRELYETYRTAGPELMCPMKGYQNYLDCSPNTVLSHLVEPLIDFEAPANVRRGQAHDLERAPVNDILGQAAPLLILKVKIHGAKVLVMFKQPTAPRGRGIKRAELPPVATAQNRDSTGSREDRPAGGRL